MDMNLFMDKLLARALECGLTAAEIYYVESNDFSAGAKQGEINSYKVSETCALGLRGLWNGKMGYASTEAFDDEAIEQLIDGVKESAELVETEEQDEIFPGEESYPTLPETETDIATVTAEEKLDAALTLEKTVKEADPRIVNVPAANVQSTVATVRLKNTYGLDLSSTEKMIAAVAGAIACEGKSTTVGYQVKAAPKFADIDIAALGKEAADWALAALNGKAVEAGEYRIIMHREAMCDLLRTFSGIFSAENAQRQMSLLAGKEGTKVASDAVTLMDDPLLPGGFGSGTFDAEGSACNRFTYTYAPLKGLGHFIHTYVCDGNPIPTFQGEPERVSIPNDIDAFANEIWENLDANNKISLYVRYVSLEDGSVQNRMFNKNV